MMFVSFVLLASFLGRLCMKLKRQRELTETPFYLPTIIFLDDYPYIPGAGITPSCWNRPRLSAWSQTSTPFPPAKRTMLMPVMVTCLPVAGIGIGVTISPVLVPR